MSTACMAPMAILSMWKPRKKTRKKQWTHLPSADHQHHKPELEILKAVAQSWFGRYNCNAPTYSTMEFDVHRRNFHRRTSRFRSEAMRKTSSVEEREIGLSWDFNKLSLLDAYETVAVSKRIEEGLVLDDDGSELFWEGDQIGSSGVRKKKKKKKESKNSLRNLFNMVF